MAEAICRTEAKARGIDVEVASAGFMAGGMPVPVGVDDAMHRRGIDMSTHVSRSLSEIDVSEADVVVCMERDHAVRLCTDLGVPFERVLLGGELLGLAATHPPVDGGLPAWLASVADERAPERVLAAPPEWQIDDPMGGPRRGYVKCADRLELVVAALLDVIEGQLDA